MSEDEAIKIILDDKKEYERIIKELEDVTYANGKKPTETIQDCQKFVQAIEKILDLYKNTKYELKGKEALVDTMSHNEEVLIKNYEILEEKLKQEREKNNRLEKFIENGEYTWKQKYNETFDYVRDRFIDKDKIRAKIKELEKLIETNSLYEECWNKIEVLKELLERR